jgi:hypothetical protein
MSNKVFSHFVLYGIGLPENPFSIRREKDEYRGMQMTK